MDVRKWKFRIEYVPMTSKMKIRARKNAPTKMEYIQPFNQRAEINAASAFGKNMYLTAQKTGCREIAVVKNYTRLNEHAMTPQHFIDELSGAEKYIFKKLYAGNFSKKLYRLYEYSKL